MGTTVIVELPDVEVVKATDMALLCLIEGDEHWIPKSQIHRTSEVKDEGDEGTLIIPLWLAEEKGIG